MANVTFTSPAMKRDVTVYATAGDCNTLLSVAQKNQIPLAFECEDGECGSCAIEVTILERKTPMGMHLSSTRLVVRNSRPLKYSSTRRKTPTTAFIAMLSSRRLM